MSFLQLEYLFEYIFCWKKEASVVKSFLKTSVRPISEWEYGLHCSIFISLVKILEIWYQFELKTYEVRGTQLSFLLLIRSADPADRRCDRETDRQTYRFSGPSSKKCLNTKLGTWTFPSPCSLTTELRKHYYMSWKSAICNFQFISQV